MAHLRKKPGKRCFDIHSLLYSKSPGYSALHFTSGNAPANGQNTGKTPPGEATPLWRSFDHCIPKPAAGSPCLSCSASFSEVSALFFGLIDFGRDFLGDCQWKKIRLQFERFQWEIWIRLEAEIRMKNNSIAAINASTLAPLCRKLNNKARKQTKVTEAKMVTPKNGITSP